jgi:hypothetical protein
MERTWDRTEIPSICVWHSAGNRTDASVSKVQDFNKGKAVDQTCGDILGPGKDRLGPTANFQFTFMEKNVKQESFLSAFMGSLRSPRIDQTHNDRSGTIVGQMRLDQFVLQ